MPHVEPQRAPLPRRAASYDFVEARVWPHGPTWPNCGERKLVSKIEGQSTRIGSYKFYVCRKRFTDKVGTVFEYFFDHGTA